MFFCNQSKTYLQVLHDNHRRYITIYNIWGDELGLSDKQYYSFRMGKRPNRLTLEELQFLFNDIMDSFWDNGYFREAIGFEKDEGYIDNIERHIYRKLRKRNLWPIGEKCLTYTEDDVFDLIELLYDLVSEPIPEDHGWYNTFTFDKEAGQQRFREEINKVIKDYNDGYEISLEGEIVLIGEQEFNSLITASIPEYDKENVEMKVKLAVSKFRNRHSSRHDRKAAVRELADVLEYLRPKIKEVIMTKDEQDLFNIANNFGIRHHNEEQKTSYDINFLTWIFYSYLATIHLCLRLIKKEQRYG